MPDDITTPPRSRLRRAAAASVPVAVGVAAAVGLELLARTGTPLLAAGGYGVVLGTGWTAWCRLAARLGPVTALAAICAGTGAVFGLLGLLAAAMGGMCNGCVAGPTVGFMLLVGVSVPLLVATAVGPVVWLVRRLPSVVSRARTYLRA